MSRLNRRLEAAFLLAALAICGIYGLSLYQAHRQKYAERDRINTVQREVERKARERAEWLLRIDREYNSK